MDGTLNTELSFTFICVPLRKLTTLQIIYLFLHFVYVD